MSRNSESMSLVTIFFGSTLPVPTIFIMLKLFKSTDISLKKSDKNTSYYPIQKIFVVIDLYCRYYYIGKWLKSGEMYLFVVKISTFAEYLEYLHRLMNKELPKYLLEKRQLMGTVTFSVLFALVFLNLYIPFSDTAWFGLGNSVYFLFTAGFAFVSLLILIVSRVALQVEECHENDISGLCIMVCCRGYSDMSVLYICHYGYYGPW